MQQKHELETDKFEDFYEPNVGWMDDPDIDVLGILQSFYPSYYCAKLVDIPKVKEDIINPNPLDHKNKAKEVFKALFKMPFIALKAISTEDLLAIERQFGGTILAHGVEEAKGGMYNLLMICMCNQVRISANYWGAFVSGLPNVSPVGHGPYYLIYNSSAAQPPSNNASLDEVSHILIPFERNREILANALTAMEAVDLVSKEQKDRFLGKLVTYREYRVQLEERLLSKMGRISFYKQVSDSMEERDAKRLARSYSF